MDEVVQASCFEVGRADLSVTRVTEAELGPPGPGEVLFEVERFGFSANNVTYALLGEALRYLDLFPAEPGWGRIPVWGYLRVVTSTVPGLAAGRRAFGLCPMASHVLLRPQRAGRATFTEGSPHRAGLSSVYNVYAWAAPGPPRAHPGPRPGMGLAGARTALPGRASGLRGRRRRLAGHPPPSWPGRSRPRLPRRADRREPSGRGPRGRAGP